MTTTAMKLRLGTARHFRHRLLLAAVPLSMAVIFTLDTITVVEVKVADLYVVPLFLISWAAPPRGVLLVASMCVVLTLLSHVVSPGDIWGSTRSLICSSPSLRSC